MTETSLNSQGFVEMCKSCFIALFQNTPTCQQMHQTVRYISQLSLYQELDYILVELAS